jgi:hypothetical protein
VLHIVPHTKALERGVIDLILGIQRTEFGLDVGNDAPPDLLDVASYYQTGAGNFWVALCGDVVVGTLGLRDIGQRQGALRKFYVKATHRGPGHTMTCTLPPPRGLLLRSGFTRKTGSPASPWRSCLRPSRASRKKRGFTIGL